MLALHSKTNYCIQICYQTSTQITYFNEESNIVLVKHLVTFTILNIISNYCSALIIDENGLLSMY